MEDKYSSLFGILEGKRKKAVEAEKRQTMQMEAELAISLNQAGIKSDEETSIELARIEQAKQELEASSNTVTIVVIGTVLVLIVAIVFFFKKGK